MDEINALEDRLSVHFEDGRIKSKKDRDEIIDELEDLFLLAYANGALATNTELGTDIIPPLDVMTAALDKVVADKTWRQRVEEYYENGGTEYDIRRIAETDATRIYNQGALDAVVVNGATGSAMKRWQTMMDDRVRDTHDYLESMTVPFNTDFYTYDGDHAPAPGMFQLPENNINCRCIIEVIRG